MSNHFVGETMADSPVQVALEDNNLINENVGPPSSFLSRINYKKIIRRKIPIITWLPTYTFTAFFQDILAGFTVSLTEIPQGIAYATVAGLPTEYGLYSGLMGGCMYFIFGTCKDINMGPTAIMALLIQPSVAVLGPDGAVLFSFLTGVLIFLAGLLHLGFVVEFFSYPIIAGFTTAAALNIAASQLNPILGINRKASEFLAAWESLFKHIDETRKWDTILAFTTMAFLFLFKYIRRFGSLESNPNFTRTKNYIRKFIFYSSLASNALAVIAGTTIAYVAKKNYEAEPFLLIGKIHEGLPKFSWPPFSTTNGTYYNFHDMVSEYGTVIAFGPMIAFLEHIAIVKAFTRGKIVDATQELIALGIGNMAGSFVQAMPVTGSFTRTAVNNASGVRTTAGGLMTSLMILVSLALLTGVFRYIPKATLGAVIMVSMYFLCKFHAIIVLWRSKKLDLALYLITFLCCLFISLEYGILIGIATNLLYILYESARPKLYIETSIRQNHVIYHIRPKVALYFTSAEYLRQQILKHCNQAYSILIIHGEFITNVDSTIARNFVDLQIDLKTRNQELILWNFKEDIIEICIGNDSKLMPFFKNGDLEEILKNY